MNITELRERVASLCLDAPDGTQANYDLLARLVDVAEAASNDGLGHYECCRANCGPPGEGWLEEEKCDCGFNKLRSALVKLKDTP